MTIILSLTLRGQAWCRALTIHSLATHVRTGLCTHCMCTKWLTHGLFYATQACRWSQDKRTSLNMENARLIERLDRTDAGWLEIFCQPKGVAQYYQYEPAWLHARPVAPLGPIGLHPNCAHIQSIPLRVGNKSIGNYLIYRRPLCWVALAST